MPIANPLGQHFIIKSATITTDRKTGNAQLDTIEVGSLIVELKVTETAIRPYVVGEVLLVDQNNLLRSLQIKGSERIDIELAPAQGNKVPPINRTFLIRGIKNVIGNDTFVLDLIEESGYVASTKVISRAYTGRLEDTIYKVVKAGLGRELKVLYPEDNKQGCARTNATHVVIPYLTVWETIVWLTDRMTSNTGTPWFVASSFYHNATTVWSMDKALRAQPFNVENPFLYSPRFKQATGGVGIEGTLDAETAINSFTEMRTDSMHALEKRQSMAGIYDQVDTNNNIVSPFEYNLASSIKAMEDDDLFTDQDVIDPSFEIFEEKMAFYPSTSMMQATSSNTYQTGLSYCDDPDEASKYNKITNKMMKNVMIQKMMSVSLPGKLFAAFKVAVGQKTRLHFESGDRVGFSKKLELDPKLSGDYLITGITHVFTNTEYNVNIDAVKFQRQDKEQNY